MTTDAKRNQVMHNIVTELALKGGVAQHGRAVVADVASRLTAQFASWQDRFTRDVDFGTDPRGVFTERDAGSRQRGTAGRPREKLDAEFSFQPEQPSTDDGLRDAKAPGSRRYPASIGHIDKGP